MLHQERGLLDFGREGSFNPLGEHRFPERAVVFPCLEMENTMQQSITSSDVKRLCALTCASHPAPVLRWGFWSKLRFYFFG